MEKLVTKNGSEDRHINILLKNGLRISIEKTSLIIEEET